MNNEERLDRAEERLRDLEHTMDGMREEMRKLKVRELTAAFKKYGGKEIPPVPTDVVRPGTPRAIVAGTGRVVFGNGFDREWVTWREFSHEEKLQMIASYAQK